MSNKDKINKKLAKLLDKGDSRVEKLLASYEKRLLAEYKITLKEIKQSIAKLYEKYGDKVTYSEMASYNRLTNLEKQIAEKVKDLTNKNIRTTNKALKDIYKENYYSTGYALESSIGVGLGFNQLQDKTITAAFLNPLDRIKWAGRMREHAKIYVNQIRSELAQGLIKGEGYGKIASNVTERTGVNAGKIMRIVRTEGHRVQNAARLAGIEKVDNASERLGIRTERLWIAVLDSRTRSDHRLLDLKPARMIDGKLQWTFPSGGTTEAPGMSGIASEDIHCRCNFITQIKKTSYNFENRKNKLKGQTYDEWKKAKQNPN